MSEPWISVVMPTYNGEAYLGAALESVAAQTAEDVEVIAVDDGSTDATLRILERYRARLSIRVVGRGHGGNWMANTNRGLAEARGEFVSILQQDDCWAPGRLEALRRLVRDRPGGVLYLHPSAFIGPDGRRLGSWRCPLPGGKVLDPRVVAGRLLVQNFIANPAPLFRRDVALRVGGLDEGLWYTADWDFWLKLAMAGETIYLPRLLASFRIHPQSQTIARLAERDDLKEQMRTVFDRNLSLYRERYAFGAAARRAALLAIDLNAFLAARYHGPRAGAGGLFARFLGLGPRGWRILLRDSRIAERVSARVRCRAMTGRAPRREGLAAGAGGT